MHIVELLAISGTAIGAIAGFAIGLMAAFGLHWLLPAHDIAIPLALLVSVCLLVGAFLGSRCDLKA